MTLRTTLAGHETATAATIRGEFIPDLAYHAGPAAPEGAGTLTLTVGGVTVRLEGLTPRQQGTLEERYGIFCGDRGTDPEAVIAVVPARRAAFLVAGQGPEYYRLETRWEGETLLACSYEWAGWLDRSRRRGGLALADGTLLDPAAFDRSLENYLRVVFAHAVIRRGGFLLHAAGLVRDGRAYLFFGPSGAGKTTVTSLSPDALILSDDLTMVVRTADGGYGACSVPFRGLFAPRAASDRTWPLAGFFRLVQDNVDRLEPLAGAMAVGELVGSLPFVTQRSEMAGDVIDAVADAARRAPVHRLHFRKDSTFWREIEKTFPGGTFSGAVDGFHAGRGI